MTIDEKLAQLKEGSIAKSVFGASDLSTAGVLNDEQSDAFIDKLIDAAVIVQDTRVERMKAPKRKFEKIGFGSRIAVAPGAQGTAPAGGDIKKPTTELVELSTVEIAVYVDLGFDTLEDNLERDGLEDRLVNRVTDRLELDLEELYLKGDTGSGDTYLALLDGWFVQSTSHIVDVNSATFTEDDVFGAMLDELPDKYLRNYADWRFYCAPKMERTTRRIRAARSTSGGDAWLTGAAPLDYMGVPIKAVPLVPSAVDATGNVLLVHPQNLMVGVQRDITFDNFRNGRKRIFEMTWTLRVDTTYEEEDAVVKAINAGV